jgi:hypothetical protein
MFMDGKEDKIPHSLEFFNKLKKEDLILMVTKEKILEMLISLLIKLTMLENYPISKVLLLSLLKILKKWMSMSKLKDS